MQAEVASQQSSLLRLSMCSKACCYPNADWNAQRTSPNAFVLLTFCKHGWGAWSEDAQSPCSRRRSFLVVRKPSRSVPNCYQQRAFQVDGDLQADAWWLLAPGVPNGRCTWPCPYFHWPHPLGASDAGHGIFFLFVVFVFEYVFWKHTHHVKSTYEDAQRFADLMLEDPNLRQLFYAFMVAEGLDMLSVAQHLAVNNPVRRFSHRCKLWVGMPMATQ